MLFTRFAFVGLLALSLSCVTGCGGSEEPQLVEGPVVENGGMSEEELNFDAPEEETSGAY
ncbi:hypothetical protein FHS27_003941 [Rhodopirellula rubra]|uniref:Secreted protein n=1 Tax=Aporhodopirellula rubra TaxID=980271 RepID=A0A7W5E1L8_9BACT|nr:hypothetical protein [Aporhodopirellula rubra]MBB3208114.1 hypothetical protein [Aporhodopirellula rubra]